MARPKSEDKRNAILAAAIKVMAELGPGAPTSKIAREAGIAEGTLFTYFATKDELLNQLYLEVKGTLHEKMMDGFPHGAPLRERVHHAWHAYVHWGALDPARRKVMQQLTVSEAILPATRIKGAEAFCGISEMIAESVSVGMLRDQSPDFAGAIMSSLADMTIDFMLRSPDRKENYCEAGFVAFWNAIGGK
ncbi:MAG: Fatty acid metabolism regulator protein [Herbaspirillum frisingense]|uniref:Fatty acid metabolism regulator protein n=1 Tax=Herbaspirillum frisingense TaxID=92645 RepID=A0A7V8G005_9BURK|nr:MAG: Fatty acid metabolism regulator protein [Herbaspirillum frisingense]